MVYVGSHGKWPAAMAGNVVMWSLWVDSCCFFGLPAFFPFSGNSECVLEEPASPNIACSPVDLSVLATHWPGGSGSAPSGSLRDLNPEQNDTGTENLSTSSPDVVLRKCVSAWILELLLLALPTVLLFLCFCQPHRLEIA